MAKLKMELEFDKEIDAILRKARGSAGAAVVTDPHLDADAVSAFAENALPVTARRLYMEHFADCDRCRKLLSQSILMNQAAVSATGGTADVASAPIGDAAVPWYQRFFRTPDLALAMGALVLVFSGVLGYLVLQNRNADSNVTVSQVNEPERQQGGPYVNGENAAVNSNSAGATNVAANPSANAANAAASTAEQPAGTKANPGPSVSGDELTSDPNLKQPEADKEVAAAKVEVPAGEPKPLAAAPPPGDDKARLGAVAGSAADSRTEEKKDEDLALAKRKYAEESRNRRDLPAAPAKSGPTRAVGPVQNQSNQVNTGIFDMPVTRSVGGKTFENRNGAWYDRAYRNQATINIRRGTDQYKKLDSGLRSIADNLGGTAIIVWKEKAYRIQ